jgi:hypothetical protein
MDLSKKTSQPSKGKNIEIQQLNDRLRRDWVGGQIVLTSEVLALGAVRIVSVMFSVAEFKDFSPDNDPHGEHDFGAVDDGSERFFWKIDYYNLSMDGHSPDPANPHLTCRVLTLMLASEY